MKTRSKELIKNTIIIMLGKFCTQFIVFLLLPLYTAYLSTKEFGIVDLIMTYVSLLTPLLSLQLENAIFRFLVDERKHRKNIDKYITSSVACLTILMAVSCLAIIIIANVINYRYTYYLAFIVVAIMAVSYILQVARGMGDNIGYSIGSMIVGITNVAFNIYFIVFLHMGIYGLLLSLIISNTISLVFLIFRTRIYKYLSPKSYDKKRLYELLKYSLPLIPGNVCWWIVSISDRVILSNIMGYSANGIYSVSNKFSNALFTVFNMFSLSWTESAALHIEDPDKDEFFSSVINRVLKLFACCVIMIIAIMPFIFNILVNKKYIESYDYIPLLLLGSIFNAVLGLISPIYIAKKMTKKIAQTSLGAGVINILINIFLIKLVGIWAAVISTVISYATMAIYRFIDVNKFVKIKLNIYNILMIVVLFTITTVIYFMNMNIVIRIVSSTAIIAIVIIANKGEIKALTKSIMGRINRNERV